MQKIYQDWFWIILGVIAGTWMIYGLARAIVQQIALEKKVRPGKQMPKFTIGLTTDNGYPMVCLDGDFSGDNFFMMEAILRKRAKFNFRWLFLSKLNALAYLGDGWWEMIDRSFTYKGSKLVLSYVDGKIYVSPKTKVNSNKEDKNNMNEIADHLLYHLNREEYYAVLLNNHGSFEEWQFEYGVKGESYTSVDFSKEFVADYLKGRLSEELYCCLYFKKTEEAMWVYGISDSLIIEARIIISGAMKNYVLQRKDKPYKQDITIKLAYSEQKIIVPNNELFDNHEALDVLLEFYKNKNVSGAVNLSEKAYLF